MFRADGEIDQYVNEFNNYASLTLGKLDQHKLSKADEKRLYNDWKYKLSRIDRAADYLCICKWPGTPHRDIDGEPITCYDERGLRRLYYDGTIKTRRIKYKDGTYRTVKYKRESIATYSFLADKRHTAGKHTNTDYVDNLAYKNGYGNKQISGDVIDDLVVQFDQELEQQVARLILFGYKKREIKKLLDISQHRLQATIDSMKSYYCHEDKSPPIETHLEIETKKCTKCGLVKSRAEFGVNMRVKSGLRTYCKECEKGYQNYIRNSKKIS